jgi:hypothetical protein
VAARKLHTKFATFAVARPLTEYKLLARPKFRKKNFDAQAILFIKSRTIIALFA